MRATRIIAIASLSVLAAACSDIYGYVPRDLVNKVGTYNIISTGVTMATDKTVTDHLVSLRSGKDCSTVRIEQGRTYCREDEPNPVANVYCYETIGNVTCYAEPDPSRADNQHLGAQ